MKKQNFTLLEIMIATIVMAIGMLGILAVFPTAMNMQRRAEDHTGAAIVAKTVYAQIQYSAREAGTIATTTGFEGPFDMPNSDYSYEYKIDAVQEAPFFDDAGTTDDLFFRATVKVYAPRNGSAEEIQSYVTYITDKTQ